MKIKKLWGAVKIFIGGALWAFTGCVVIVAALSGLGIGYRETPTVVPGEVNAPGAFSSTDESDVYHLSTCWKSKDQTGRKVYYDSCSAAERDRKELCGMCSVKLDAYKEAGLTPDNKDAYYKGYVEGYFDGLELSEVDTADSSFELFDANVLAACGILFGGASVWVFEREKRGQKKKEPQSSIFSGAKAIADVQRIKNGGFANLSISQITTLIINLPDAKKNLTTKEFDQVYALYQEMRKCKTQIPMDMNAYCAAAIKIIKEFDKIAPYEKYSGGNETEFSFMMADIRGKNYEEIRQLKERIAKTEKALADYEKSNRENMKLLAEAFTDQELERMVARGEFPADRVDEYIKNRRGAEMLVAYASTYRESSEKLLANMRRDLARLEDEN